MRNHSDLFQYVSDVTV